MNDLLIDRYFITIPRIQRMEILGQIIHHETDQLALMRVFFDPQATLISNRIKNVAAGAPWNAEKWELIS